ncbi:hypothetical protein SAMN05444580_10140 [Rhodococcus tukisamuensis]|uniref:Alternate signal-mediated exported protein, RER_14450 family n=2 Tax=Rhodococcus tukisamuensis TaxID=168276 RepID=A0A1G6M3S5_9NOCA|nr:hypothetical protein SAMN05444580_10140 [Rhodococcus tukisamuensis]
MMRRGASILAAVAVAAGGLAVGAGTANATGSSGPGSSAPPCAPEGAQLACDDGQFYEVEKAGNIRLAYHGPDEAVLGQEIAFTSEFEAGDSDYQDVQPEVAIASVTHHAPRGFEFTGATVTAAKYELYPATSVFTPLEATVVVDPVTGDVTVTAPAGGWAAPKTETNNGILTGTVVVKLAYKATELVSDGTSGVTFTGTDVPASEGWMAAGTTKVVPVDLGGFGSLS